MSGSNIYVAGSVFYRDTDILNNVISIDMSKSVIVPRHFGQIYTPMSNPIMVDMGGGKIYALAGWSSVFPDDNFAVFDPKKKTWTCLKPPPFYSFPTLDYRPEAAVVLNGQLHVSTRFDAYRFLPKKQKWKKSNLFDECPVQRIKTHSLPRWTRWFENIKAGGKPFPFNGLGIALLNGQVLICYSDTNEGHVAFLVKNWKVVDVHFLSSCGVNHDGELESPPCYVDLGKGYFSIFWYRHNYDERSFFGDSILNVSTFRIWLSRKNKNAKGGRSPPKNGDEDRNVTDTTESNSDSFLGVEHVSSYSYPQARILDGRKVMWRTLGLFLLISGLHILGKRNI